jgi:hypothetical protein
MMSSATCSQPSARDALLGTDFRYRLWVQTLGTDFGYRPWVQTLGTDR